jgi:hypothetical protein
VEKGFMLAMGNYPKNIGPIRTKKAEPSDVDGMARCHINCFLEQFTSRMGMRFTKSFYKKYILQADGVAFVAVEQGSEKVVGLIVGGDPDYYE